MMDFIIKHKIINPSQHGFLKARSCLTNLLCFFEEITKWVDEGSPVDNNNNNCYLYSAIKSNQSNIIVQLRFTKSEIKINVRSCKNKK